MTAAPPRRLWWKRKRWWAAGAMLVVAYPASIGPAYFVGHEWCPRLLPHVGRADVPIYRLARGTGLLPLWEAYTGRWVDLAYRECAASD